MVTSRWMGALVLALCFALLPAGAALADHRAPFDGTQHDYGEMVDYPLVFPVAGDYRLRDTFDAARSNGDHHAQDIMADKMVPIVAAASGTIRYINWSRNPDDLNPERCCTMVITHDDGWETWYIHMNNDTPGTDDGEGWGIADGLEPGDHVEAGQLIGWVGDSGNAEYTGSHLHFELYDPEGVIVNPYEALLAADDPDCSTGCEPFESLQRGSRGNRVVQLQLMLEAVGFDPQGADGVFGALTESAVAAFQADHELPSDGVVDGTTWSVLLEVYGAEPPPVPDPCPEGATCDGVMLIDAWGVWSRYEHLGGDAGRDEFWFGNRGDVPFSGDWDCDGVATPGLYRRSDGFVYLRQSNTTGIADLEFYFGNPGDIPVVGDFDGDGCDTVSIYRPAEGRFYVINTLGSEGDGLGAADFSFIFGNIGDRPFVGDFDGDGIDTVGLHRASTGFAYLRNSLTEGVADQSFYYGNSGDVILAGDWDGDGADSVAVYRPSSGVLYLSFANRAGVADRQLSVGTHAAAVVGARGPLTTGPITPGPSDGPPEIVYDPSQDSEQWRPLVEYVFAQWGLDTEKCGTGDRSADCIGGQVDNAIVIMECESFGDPNIVNTSSGTTGLFQNHPDYWDARVARVQSHFPDFPDTASPYEPYDNVMVAALLVDESRDALIGENSLTGPWDDGPEPWGHWVNSSRNCADPPLVSP